MKKVMFSIVLLICCTFLFYGLVLAEGKKSKAVKKPVSVEASGKALWDYLVKNDYTKKWKMWPGKKALYKGTEPHGALLTTYVNDTALKGIKSKKGVLPNGSIVAKENYSPDKKLMAITVMYKVKGYNPEAGDWFWVKYAPDGKIAGEGKMDMCINCHSKKKENDYLFTGSLK